VMVFSERFATIEVLLTCVKAHPDGHKAFADQVRLTWFFHPDRDIGFAHRQVNQLSL